MSSVKQLRNAAKEVVDVLGLVDDNKKDIVINEKWTEEDLKELLKGVIADKLITPKDEISEETNAVLEELENEEETPEEEAEEVEEAVNPPSLEEEVENAKKLADLKDIAKANDEFKSIRGRLHAFKTVDELRDEMLDLLDNQETAQKLHDKNVGSKPVNAGRKPVKEEDPEDEPEEEEIEEKKPAKPAKPKNTTGKTKKSIIEEMISSKKGATIEEMAKRIVDEGIDADYKKNLVVTKLWLSKMGFATNKAAIEKNPVFKKK